MLPVILIASLQALGTSGHAPAPTPASNAAPKAPPSVVLTVTISASRTEANICCQRGAFHATPDARTCLSHLSLHFESV